jgi:serine/threonine protein kinase
MTEQIDKQIGKYRLEEKIGRGAMAEVFKAYHPNLDKHVAIKILHSFLAEKTDILNRFQREARHVAALNHNNIVKIHDFDVAGSLYYMVMEFIDGPTLKAQIKTYRAQGQLVAIPEAVDIIRQVGQALEYAHSHGVIHRDIKPANVMIEGGGRVILTDFGLAKILSGPQFTTTGALVGTPAYMSPEQGLGKPGDARSDIYSLGAMLYQLITGRFPFTAETPLAIVFKHINAPLPWPRTVNPDIPENLEKVIVKAMAKNPEERYQDVGQFLADVNALGDASSVGPDSDSGPVPPFHPAFVKDMAVALHVVETGQILALEDAQEFSLGRLDGGVRPEIDLSPYNAYGQGVSRLHAKVLIEDDNKVSVTDLGSTNGTWVNGAKATPHVPIVLYHGDVIALGKLILQALIRN